MYMYEEDCYPRGGSRPAPNKVDSHPHSDKQENLFGLNNKRKATKAKKRQRKNTQGLQSRQPRDGDAYRSNSAEVLSFKTIQEGMLVLGCVKDISSLALAMELPGLLFCTLQVNCISEAFTRQLSERLESDAIDEDKELHILNSIFKRGQFIPTRVIQIEFTGTKTKVFLSTKPSDVNTNYYHADFRSGTLIWAAVVEKSDHGYILDVGVKHVRIILPFKQVEAGKEYVIGEPLWCVVKLATSSSQVTTLTVSALQCDVDASVQTEVSHVEKIMPGMRVKFRAEKSLKDGLEGTIFTDSVAYINEVHLSEPFALMENYVGETLPALVLYVQPTTKFTFLTLHTTRMGHQRNLSVGQILPAQVISRTDKGIFLKLTKKEKGFITQHRLRNSSNLTNFTDMEALIEAKYPKGSTHKCRILDHTFMDDLYVCTFEKQVLDEKIFTVSDIQVGEVIKGTVQEINNSGITVKLGNLKGFVTNEHLCNARYSEVFKTKFKKGQMVTGRVWLNKGPFNIKLTLKSAFVESDVCLKDYEEAQVNSQYPGMVVKITASGALIKFYNEVQGWLKQAPNSQQQHSFKQLLYEGQVVSVWVVKKEGARLTLSLENPSIPRELDVPEVQTQGEIEAKPQRLPTLKVGQIVTARVTKIRSDGINVTVDGGSKLTGFIPVNHLCSDPSLGTIMLWFYQAGDEIKDLICISNRKRRILSRSEARYFTQEKYEIPKRLKKNSVIRCYFGKAKETLLSLICPIRQNVKDIIVDKRSFKPFKKYQPIMVRVSNVKNKHYAIGSANLADVYSFDFEYSARRLDRYLDDVALIQRMSVERNDPLGRFMPGERLLCTVVSFNQKGCTVTLTDGVKGVVARRNCPVLDNLKLNQTHTGVVLWTDFVNKHVEIALKPEIANKINVTQDGVVSASPNGLIWCEVLSLHENFVLCLLGNGQLAFIPTQLHENDFSPDCSYYKKLQQGFEFRIVSTAKKRIIGFEFVFERNGVDGPDDKKEITNENLEDDEFIFDESSNDVVEIDNKIIKESSDSEEIMFDELSNDVVEFDQDIIDESDEDDFNITQKTEDDSPEENENYAEVEESQEQEIEGESTERENDDRVDLDDQEDEQVFDDENGSDLDNSEDYADVSREPERPKYQMNETEKDKIEEQEDLSDITDSEDEDNEELMSERHEFSDEAETEQNSDVISKLKTREQMHFLVTGNENSDAPDFEQARRIKSKAALTLELSKIKPVNKKKKKEDRTQRELRRAKRIRLLRRTLQKIQDTEELLYNKSYEIDPNNHPVLPGVQHFFESDKEKDDVSGSSENETEPNDMILNKGKKRKLSRREQADLVREQEEYLRGKEEELINSEGAPQNVEQFDRRLLGEPNSSELWAQYIAFHIQSTEIDKARAVAQRALKTIQQSAVQDRLNVWLTYLNLEGMYGTRETFDQVFEEAVRCNDALTIYLEAIKILAETSSADEKIKKAKNKFKQEARMFIEVGKVYYKQNRLADARKLKDSALRTILDKKKHVPLIVQFAIMEFNSGEENHGEALFETILQSDPRRTDVWGTYVDQLVKKNKIDLARRVFQRAVAQKLNYKKMKVLYKKFQEFEQRYGTSESQAHVKELLQEYASQFVDA